MRFRFDPFSRAFENLCVFNENAQRISVDGRPKRIEMYAFSKEKAFGWTEPKLSKEEKQSPPWTLHYLHWELTNHTS